LTLARHAEDTIVLVGHDSVNRALLLQFLGMPLASYWYIAQGPCCVNEIDIEDGRSHVLRLNEMLHVEKIVLGVRCPFMVARRVSKIGRRSSTPAVARVG
jgi:Histidine phosphatase superfamily (branch 1)